MKECKKCGVNKSINDDNFPKSKTSKDGFINECKECKSRYAKQYRIKNREELLKKKSERYYNNHELNKEKRRQYYQDNKEEFRLYGIEYRKNNPEVIRERDRRYRINNIEELAIKAKVYADNNREHLQEYKRKHRLANIKEITEKERIYRLENPDVGRMAGQRYRAKMNKLPYNLTNKQWGNILNDFGGKCAYCGMTEEEHLKEWNERLHQDHFIALDSGGEYTADNIIPACRSCNSRKSNRSFFDWYKTHECYDETKKNFILEYLGYEDESQQLSIL